MPDQISVSEFIAETTEDYNSPTTSSFTTRLHNCRNTVTLLEEMPPRKKENRWPGIMFQIFCSVLMIAAVAESQPHTPTPQKWVIINLSTGGVAASNTSTDFPFGKWFPDLYVDLCDLVDRWTNPSKWGCNSAWNKAETRKTRFYVCPGHSPTRYLTSQCGDPGMATVPPGAVLVLDISGGQPPLLPTSSRSSPTIVASQAPLAALKINRAVHAMIPDIIPSGYAPQLEADVIC